MAGSPQHLVTAHPFTSTPASTQQVSFASSAPVPYYLFHHCSSAGTLSPKLIHSDSSHGMTQMIITRGNVLSKHLTS
ncbi:hypothetical protein SCLCIDRAFT_1222314 [Scleroderma citrinum Foug A]|uniref:Uncharacterized protein n=1 Tax=Scleroderma citrinum Foug A TaxID=1036808 RepID=A0A0C2YWM7_9AGAM|nr:hypothetical protein SCLCIDRAFT_1222314 [Scleroderma citrinum Foug A]